MGFTTEKRRISKVPVHGPLFPGGNIGFRVVLIIFMVRI